MNWIEKILKRGVSDPANTFIIDTLDANRGAPDPVALRADEEYVSIVVKSIYIPFRRLQLATFHGTIISQVNLAHAGTGEASFHVVNSPDLLRIHDSNNLSKVIHLNQVLLDRIPYRGGRLNVEIGLFADKSGDLARPMVEIISKVAGAAGVGFVGAVQPFVTPLRQAIDILSGVPGALTLLLGLHGSIDAVSGFYVVIATSRDSIDIASLRIRPGGRELMFVDGREFTQAAYMIIAIESAKFKEDFFRIPELLAASQRVKSALTQTSDRNRFRAAQDAMSHFRVTVLTSPDLLLPDAKQIVERAQIRMNMVLGLEAGVSKISADMVNWPDNLKDL